MSSIEYGVRDGPGQVIRFPSLQTALNGQIKGVLRDGSRCPPVEME